MKRRKLLQKLQYHFDNIMSKGTIALIGLLFLITMIVVVLFGVLAAFTGAEGSVGSQIWMSMMHALDTGTLAADGQNNIPYLVLMSMVTLCGLFITSILIGIITTGFEGKLKELRKGTSKVLEEDHTLILGFNDNIYTLLNELIGANENKKDACIVVVGDQEKEEMEEAIASRIPDTKTTRIICRSGALYEPHVLERCSAENCKSIIVNVYDDPQTIKVILMVGAYLKDKKLLHSDVFITAAINEAQNVDAARIAGEGRAEVIFANDAISRIIAHTCRQPGLSNVLVELFDYDGDELYFETVPEVYGLTFKETLNRFPKAVVFGICDENGTHLNPPMDTIIKEGDRIILLEDDDGSFELGQQAVTFAEEAICEDVNGVNEPMKKNLLVLGSNHMLMSILKEYDCYVHSGTKVTIVAEEEINLETEDFRNIVVSHLKQEGVKRALLEELLTENTDNILILSSDTMEAEAADSRTILQLIFLWDISQKTGRSFTITSEMKKTTNQKLVTQARVDDFVIGSNIVNLLMTQIAENRKLTALFEDILDEDGSELYMKPVNAYVKTGIPVDFYTVTESAARKGHIAIGYKKVADGEKIIVTNPEKSEKIVFSDEDVLIVVAED